jgi:hypothetical protein
MHRAVIAADGDTVTSENLSSPFAVGQAASNRCARPASASATALSINGRDTSGHMPDHGLPAIAAKSSICMADLPLQFMNCSVPSLPTTLMQSSLWSRRLSSADASGMPVDPKN